jgi:hypothetical protein
VLGSVHPVPIEAELAYPVSEPLDQVVARSARIASTVEEGVELLDLLVPTTLRRPFVQ